MMESCRICRGDESDGPLKVPCKCTGSISSVHEDCLVDWLERLAKRPGHGVRSEQSCELCGYVYVFKPIYSTNMDSPAHGFIPYVYQIWKGSASLRVKSSLIIRALLMVLVASYALNCSFTGMTTLAEYLSSPAALKHDRAFKIRFSFPFVDGVRMLFVNPRELFSQIKIGLGLVVVTLVFVIMAWTISTWILHDPVLALEIQQLLTKGIELDNEEELRREVDWVKSLVRNANVNGQARAQLLARIDNGIDQNWNWIPERERRAIEVEAARDVELIREPPDEEGDDFWAGADELFGGPALSKITAFFMYLSIFNTLFVGIFCFLPYMVGFSIASYIHVHVYNFGLSEFPKSFEYRVLYFFMGLRVFFAFMEAPYHNFSRLLKSSPNGRTMIAVAKQISAIEKVWVVIVTETVLFPVLCGILLNVAALPIMVDPSIQNMFEDIRSHHRVYLPVLWAVGMCYMYTLSDFFKTCRKILRPGTLYFIQDPTDPKNEPIRNFLSSSLYTLFKKIGLSALIYIVLILGCIGGVTSLMRWSGIVPLLIAPLDLKTIPGWEVMCYWYVPLVGNYMLKSSMGYMGREDVGEGNEQPSPYVRVFTSEFRRVADWLNLGSFLFNDEHHGDKGGIYIRAPDQDNVALRKGTDLFVPVDSDDKRLSPQKPGRRDMESYTVVWRPNFFWVRIAALIGWIWLVSAAIVSTIILVPLLAGRGAEYITMTKNIISNDMVHYLYGAFLICGCTNVVDRALSSIQTHQTLQDEVTTIAFYGVVGVYIYDLVDMAALAISPKAKEYVQPSTKWLTAVHYQLILYALGSGDGPGVNPWHLAGLLVLSCISRYSLLNVLVLSIYLAATYYYSPAVVEWRETAIKNYYIVCEELQDYEG